ncbi:MAG: hypothetical protein K9H16_04030 [Bacteroidales bacterium]|nr:hypothetical protein [Bacteroidales bacterium]
MRNDSTKHILSFIYLRKSREKQGNIPIYMRISVQNTSAAISLNFSTPFVIWDPKKGYVKTMEHIKKNEHSN